MMRPSITLADRQHEVGCLLDQRCPFSCIDTVFISLLRDYLHGLAGVRKGEILELNCVPAQRFTQGSSTDSLEHGWMVWINDVLTWWFSPPVAAEAPR